MSGLRSTLTRAAAIVVIGVLVVVPPLAIGMLIGRPYPDWSTLTDEVGSGRVSADTVMRIAAMLFVAIWLWILAVIAAEVRRLTVVHPTATAGSRRSIAATQPRRSTFLHRLVRIAVLGTVTTAATVSTWSSVAIASSPRSPAGFAPSPTAVEAPADPIAERPMAPATTTIVADGRDTPLSIAVDLGDETLRDDIIAMNKSTRWSGGVFPEGMTITVPVVESLETDHPVEAPESPADVYVVQPGDGMWSVAEALLGDGARHSELAGLLDGQEVAPGVTFTSTTATIHPGWVFHRPASLDTPAHDGTHVVQAGDTLSGIAQQHLGDADRWPEIWDANAANTMVDGRTFDDPDLILPGWQLALPTVDAAPSADELDPAAIPDPTPPEPAPTEAPDTDWFDDSSSPAGEALPHPTGDAAVPSTTTPAASAPTAPPPTTPPRPTSTPEPAVSARPTGGTPELTGTDRTGIWTDVERSVWPAVVAGSLLTAGVAFAVRRLRNRRLGQLEPGQRLATPPDPIAGTEHALLTRTDTKRLDTINTLLRSFTPHAARHDQPPAVRAVQIGDEHIEVLLASPDPVTPRGWATVDGGHSWTHHFDDPVDDHRQLLTPALVTIGARTADDHAEVLLDLETAGSLTITGDRTGALGLARSIVLELATYPLGVSMDVTLVGLAVPRAEHFDRIWAGSTLERAHRVATRRTADRAATGETITAARSRLDDDDGAHDPHVIVIDTAALGDDDRTVLDEIVAACTRSSGTAAIVVGDLTDTTERIIVDADGTATWSGVDLRLPNVTDTAAAEIADLLEHSATSEPEPVEPDDFMDALLADSSIGDTRDPDTELDPYEPPEYDVLVRVMGEPRADGVELSADQTELLALLTCLRHRTEIHIDLIHDSVAPEGARKTIENRMSKLRRLLGTGTDGHDLLPDAASGRGGRSHYLVSPLVLTDLDLLEHRYHASRWLSSGEAIAVLTDGLDLMRGPLLRSRRGFDAWPHSEGVIVEATGVVQSYACRLIELAAEADDAALVLRTTKTASRVLDDPIAECPIRQAEQRYADASGNAELVASVEHARRRLLQHIDDGDTFAEAG